MIFATSSSRLPSDPGHHSLLVLRRDQVESPYVAVVVLLLDRHMALTRSFVWYRSLRHRLVLRPAVCEKPIIEVTAAKTLQTGHQEFVETGFLGVGMGVLAEFQGKSTARTVENGEDKQNREKT